MDTAQSYKYNTIEEAVEELRKGKIILVTDDPDRENEGDMICAAEFATQANINFMATHAKGLICTPMSAEVANRLGLLDEAYITESCIRLFTTRFLLGMFEETEYDKIPYSVVECPQHVAIAHRAAAESMVLFKNDGVLPISNAKRSDDRNVNRSDDRNVNRSGDRSGFTIAVIGPNANSRAALVGNYHGTSSRYVTVLEGIMDRAEREGIRVYYSEGCHLFKDRVEDLALPGSRDRLAEALTISEL